MTMSLTFNTKPFEKALKEFQRTSKKNGQRVLMDQAKLFVRDVVSVTPPNKDATMRMGVGTARVRSQIYQVMRGTSRASEENPRAIHKQYRRRNGNVGTNLKEPTDKRHRVQRDLLKAYIERKTAMVGFLAAGWNAAARKLGARMPAWIARHGTRFGSVVMTLGVHGIGIKIANAVPYVGNVGGMRRRVQWALYNRANQMTKQLKDYAVKRAAREAGL
jgi:hypothetical protein